MIGADRLHSLPPVVVDLAASYYVEGVFLFSAAFSVVLV